jgi:excisionase family DNA binding protein
MARVFTVDEAAEYLRVSPYTIRKWLRTGKIPSRRVGRIYRILETDVEALLGEPHFHSDEDMPQVSSPDKGTQTSWSDLTMEQKKLRADSLLGKFADSGVSSEDIIRDRREEVARDERRWKRREWDGMTKEQKWAHLTSLKGKYAHIQFSSDDLARERREETEREDRKWRR